MPSVTSHPQVFGIIGKGAVEPKVLQASLNDLPSNALFVLEWVRTPTYEMIYDHLLDNNLTFSVVGNPPKVVAAAAVSVYEEGTVFDVLRAKVDQNPTVLVLNPTVLVLWEDGIEDQIYEAAHHQWSILELSNGLTPIDVEDDTEAPVASPVPVEEQEYTPEVASEVESRPFSMLELENMPAAAVKRYATGMGIDIKGKTKSEIIDEIFFGSMTKDMNTLVQEQDAQEREPIAIVVLFNNNSTMTINSTKERVAKIVSMLTD